MAYRKNQGRYARMFAFWTLALLLAYGCLGGLQIKLGQWLDTSDTLLVGSFPLFGEIRVSTLIAIGVLLVGGFLIYRILAKPKVVDSLIDTEAEMRKVTWPTMGETWTGTIAVIVTVLVLLVFLTGADYVLLRAISFVLRPGGAA